MSDYRSAAFILSISLLALHTQAQSNYRQGYVVTNTGDTLHGFIDQKEWGRNPRSFSFKKSLEDKPTEFNTREARYFSVEADAFLRYIGRISMDKNTLKQADVLKLKFSTDTVFLKTLAKGKFATLFTYRDELKTRLFLSFSSNAPEELIYRLYPDETQSNQVVVDDRYKSVLIQAAQSAGALNDNMRWVIKKSTYGNQSIAKIVNKINGDTDTGISRKKKKATNFFVGLAVNQSDWHFDDKSIQSKPGIGPYVAVGFSHMPNSEVGRFVIRAELGLCITSPTISSSKFTQSTLSISPQLLYNFYNTDKAKIYLGAGLRLNKSFYTPNDYAQANQLNFVPLWLSFNFQAGVLINRRTEIFACFSPQWGEFAVQQVGGDSQWVNYSRIGLIYHFGVKK